jgi:hypothetical protein
MFPSLSKKDITVPNCLIDLQLHPDLIATNDKTLVTGDSHAGTGNLLILAYKFGLIDIPPDVAKELDRIAQSSLIDQLETAWEEYEQVKSIYSESSEACIQAVIKAAENRYSDLRVWVTAEKEAFDNRLSLIQKKATDKQIKGVGDDVADRNYCDWHAIKVGLKIEFGKLISNHGAELLDAWVNNKWNLESTYYLSPDFTHSLRTFKILLKHGIVSEAERDELLKAWASTLDIMWYSRLDSEDKKESQVSFYTHAPGRVWRIFQLADMYNIPRPQRENYHTLRLDDLCEIVKQVMEMFKESLNKFCSSNSEETEEGRKELAFFLQKGIVFGSPANILMNLRSEEYIRFENTLDAQLLGVIQRNEEAAGKKVSLNWVYGHDTSQQPMPADMKGLDTDYWKPYDAALLQPLELDMKDATEVSPDEFQQLTLHNMREQNIYYVITDNSHIDFKVIVTRSAIALPIYNNKGAFVRYDEFPKAPNPNSNYEHQPHYFSGVVPFSESIEEINGNISQLISRRTQAFLEEYEPASRVKIKKVPVVTTSQHFPECHFGKYVFLGKDKVGESLARNGALANNQTLAEDNTNVDLSRLVIS